MIKKTEKGISYMTSDAKIGLLLGFVFILVIVSLVNGLPGLIGKDSADKGINTSVPPLDNNYGLDNKARGVVNFLKGKDSIKFGKRNSGEDGDDRFGNGKGLSGKGNGGSSDKKRTASNKKFYVVKDGDILGKIAVKVYGLEIGKKQATRDMIFKANSHILDSPDDIDIGQKLIMPSLSEGNKTTVQSGSNSDNTGEEELIKTGMFEKVGRSWRNIFSKKDKRKTSPLSASLADYVVKEGDNLTKIASKRLGSGARWREIQKINNGILKGSVKLSLGMKLKIPQK